MSDQNSISVKEIGITVFVSVKSENIDVICPCSRVHIAVIDETVKQYHIILFKDGVGSFGIFTKDLPLLIDEKLDVKTDENYGFRIMDITRRVKQ